MPTQLNSRTTELAAAILDVLDAAKRPMTVWEVRQALGPRRPISATVRASLNGLVRTKEVLRGLHEEIKGSLVYSTDTGEEPCSC